MDFSKEPAVIISSITAFLTAVIGLGAAFGLDLSQEQQNAVIGVVAPTVTAIFALGFFIRQFVTPVEKAEDKIQEAFFLDPAVDEKPSLTTSARQVKRGVGPNNF